MNEAPGLRLNFRRDNRWRKGGSLIQDVWRGAAADLATMEAIAVFPRAKGWWATRKYGADRQEHDCHLNPVPYYHVALPELRVAVAESLEGRRSEQGEDLEFLIKAKRLRDISDLPLDLAI